MNGWLYGMYGCVQCKFTVIPIHLPYVLRLSVIYVCPRSPKAINKSNRLSQTPFFFLIGNVNHPKLGAIIFNSLWLPGYAFVYPSYHISHWFVRLPHLFSTSSRCPLLFLFGGHVSDLLKFHETTKPHQGFATLGSFAHLVAKAWDTGICQEMLFCCWKTDGLEFCRQCVLKKTCRKCTRWAPLQL